MQNNLLGFILPLIFLGMFYIILLKPQKERQKQVLKMREELKIGDKVTTIGGFIGTINKMDDNKIELKTGDSSLEILKTAIASILEEKKEEI
ncbi:MAG: preprotein translocase subunit YajC [Peptostreptococcaceae bacterium]|nr:preprotein translocase subunit YajC [Peptostreptococcaceae bacterium]